MNLLFDLDGTIGDTLPLCIAAFRESIEPLLGRSLSDEDIIATFGPSEEGTVMALVPDHYDEGMERYLKAYERMHGMCRQAFDGMPELLRDHKAKGHYVGMVTGKGPLSTEITLNKYGLSDVFDVIKTGSLEGPVKDRHFKAIVEETGIPTTEFLYIGDAPSDITAAHSCGMPIAAAAWADTADVETLKNLKPDFLFESIEAFKSYLDSLA
jgi:phosphoglycolate phosphatase/pyrophosphatase PpaX